MKSEMPGDVAQFVECFLGMLEALGLNHGVKLGVVLHTVIKVLGQKDQKF